MIEKLKLVLLVTFLTYGLNAQVSIERNLNLELAEKDSLTSFKIEKALNGFLAEAKERNYTSKYVDSMHLLKYQFFFDKLGGIGNHIAFHDPLVLKSYPIEEGNYRLTIGFTGEKEGKPFIYQITELKAIPYEDHYRFYCPFEDNTKHFKSKTFDNVTYHFSSSLHEGRAKEFVGFTQDLAELANGPIPKLDYYSFNSLDELLKSYGFLYSARQCNFLCYDLGFADNGGKTYMTGTGNENYVFGFISEYLYYYLPNRDEIYWPYVQGLSAYYGGYGLSYDDMNVMKRQFRNELKSNPDINFLDEFKKGRKSSINRHFSYYVMSAFLFEKILSEKGFDEAFQLVYTGSEGEHFFDILDQIIAVNQENFHKTILELIKEIPEDSKRIGSSPLSPDTLSFYMTEANNIIFQAVLNENDTLDLYFDTGGTELVLKQDVIEDNDYTTLEGIHSCSLDQVHWDSLTIFPARIGPKEADGHFGWNLFEGKIVELDYEKKIMIVHSSIPDDLEDYAKLKIEYINTLFCINSSIQVGESKFTNRYLFDLGFQRSVVLDKNLRQKSNFPDTLTVIKESRLKNSAGKEFINRVVEVDKICFDRYCANQVPVQLLSTPNPARFETHILGGELLKRFNTILDFQNGFVYMKPNSLLSLPYKDAP
ncbi:MAG: hypothetical protein AAF806_28075 [Bacteroidota bacterium]